MNLELDEDGHLKNLDDWSEDVAIFLAKQENINLSDHHWLIILRMRDFYKEYNVTPAIRSLVKLLKEEVGNDKGNSMYLQSLFPDGLHNQAGKIAGLPKQTRCL